ncbi:hypothetical protein ACFP3U_02105 [Kitasatospora misakiensis]|uniref:Uncharacterized protein n=1 Tax=Kitasatospora misakiensis TaxID=67330 RepID=A0ABW0WW67_9ACTN
MSSPHTPAPLTVSVLDHDPLREARDLRSLREALQGEGVGTDLRRTAPASADPDAKGASEVLSLVFGGGSLAVAVLQTWLARVPARRLRIERADGGVLEIDGRTQREDAEVVRAFCSADNPRQVEGE